MFSLVYACNTCHVTGQFCHFILYIRSLFTLNLVSLLLFSGSISRTLLTLVRIWDIWYTEKRDLVYREKRPGMQRNETY
jgi:hypothetical protein